MLDEFGLITGWYTSNETLSIPRKGQYITEHNDQIYVFGGIDADNNYSDAVDIFNVDSETGDISIDNSFTLSLDGLVKYVDFRNTAEESTVIEIITANDTNLTFTQIDENDDRSYHSNYYETIPNDFYFKNSFIKSGDNIYSFWLTEEDLTNYSYVSEFNLTNYQWDKQLTEIDQLHQATFNPSDKQVYIASTNLIRYDISKHKAETLMEMPFTSSWIGYMNGAIYSLAYEMSEIKIYRYNSTLTTWELVNSGSLSDVGIDQYANLQSAALGPNDELFLLSSTGSFAIYNAQLNSFKGLNAQNTEILTKHGDNKGTLCLFDNKFIYAGINENIDYTSQSYIFDFANGTWIEKSNLNEEKNGTIISQINDNPIMFFGTHGTGRNTSVEKYSYENNSWEIISEFKGDETGFDMARWNYAGLNHVVIDGKNYFLGGQLALSNSRQEWVFY